MRSRPTKHGTALALGATLGDARRIDSRSPEFMAELGRRLWPQIAAWRVPSDQQQAILEVAEAD